MHTFEELALRYGQYMKDNSFTGKPDNLYEPMNYILSLGGKRIRPVVSLLSYQLFKDELTTEAFHVAHTVELFHNFSLIHDDIMDQAPLRRGNPTVHIQWDTPTAILSGDLMLVKAYECLLKTQPASWQGLLSVFNDTATAVCEGQQKDMDFEKRDDVSKEESIDMIRQKTAVLLGASLQMGALAAGAASTDAESLYRFGVNAGIAFQIMDDYLDVFGSENSGKQAGGDILSNKKTLIYLLALASASANDQAELNRWYSLSGQIEGKVEAVTGIFRNLQADKNALQLVEDYYRAAENELENLKVSDGKKEPLYLLLTMLKGRKN